MSGGEDSLEVEHLPARPKLSKMPPPRDASVLLHYALGSMRIIRAEVPLKLSTVSISLYGESSRGARTHAAQLVAFAMQLPGFPLIATEYESEDFILKLSGRDEYLTGDEELQDYLGVREQLAQPEPLQLTLTFRSDLRESLERRVQGKRRHREQVYMR